MSNKPKLSEFLNDVEELHALCIGVCEVIAFCPPRFAKISAKQKNKLKKEFHYYMLGRAAGVIAWIVLAVAIKAVFF